MKNATDIGGADALKRIHNSDGWLNVFTGMGVTGKDKDKGAGFGSVITFDETTADAIYRGDGVGTYIVDRPASDMTRAGFKVAGDTDGSLVKYLERTVKLSNALEHALQMESVFGAACVVIVANDGGKLDMPINLKNLKEVEDLVVYDRWRMAYDVTSDIQNDPNKKGFGQLEYIRINPRRDTKEHSFRVHRSRFLLFNNRVKTTLAWQENDRWGDSIFTQLWKQLYRLDKAYDASSKVLDDFITSILKIKNLQEMMAGGQEDLVKKRLQMIDLAKHIANTIIIDDLESYEKKASTVTGIADLLHKFEGQLSTVAGGMPLTMLTGESPSGFGSDEDPQTRKWYDVIDARREKELYDPIAYITELVMLSKLGPTKGTIIKDWDINFNSLWQVSDKTKAETRKIISETDANYFNMSALHNTEIRNSRFGGEEYSSEIKLDPALDDIMANPEDVGTGTEGEDNANIEE